MEEHWRGTDEIIPILMEEYKSLRQESLNAIANRNQIMGLTLTALSIIISFASLSKIPNLLAATVLMLLVPGISKVVSLIWLGEYQRSKRAGSAIEQIEKTINSRVNFAVLTWETDLAKRHTGMTYPYVATFAVLLGAGYMSIVISFFFLLRSASVRSSPHPVLIALSLSAFVLVLEAWFAIWLMQLWRKARTQFHQPFASGK